MRIRRIARRPDAFAAALPLALRQVRDAMWSAMGRYRPQPYDGGPIIYVRAEIRQKERGDPMPLWRRVARAGLAIADVPGSHDDMVVEPNVRLVAAELDRALSDQNMLVVFLDGGSTP
jgi:acetoacetyl-CoA synthetase